MDYNGVVRRLKIIVLSLMLAFSNSAKAQTNTEFGARFAYLALAAKVFSKAYCQKKVAIRECVAVVIVGGCVEAILKYVKNKTFDDAYIYFYYRLLKYDKLIGLSKELRAAYANKGAEIDRSSYLITFCQEFKALERDELQDDLDKLEQNIKTLVSHGFVESNVVTKSAQYYSDLKQIKSLNYDIRDLELCECLFDISREYLQELVNPVDLALVLSVVLAKNTANKDRQTFLNTYYHELVLKIARLAGLQVKLAKTNLADLKEKAAKLQNSLESLKITIEQLRTI